MAAVPKEIFSPLEKKILTNYKIRSKVAKLDRQDIGLYFSTDIAIFLTGVSARGIYSFYIHSFNDTVSAASVNLF
jgi:hypothetical protein